VILLGILYHIGWAGVAYAAFCRAHFLRRDARVPVRVGVSGLLAGAVWMCIEPISGMSYNPASTFVGVALCLFLTTRCRGFRV
jgi:hypothetical protein